MNVEETQALADAMRAGLRRAAQGVYVISACNSAAERCAMTASSVTSVSMEPPSLLVCANQTASLYAVLQQKRPFCVNILAEGMEDISNLCAGGADGEARFGLGDWRRAEPQGVPYLAGSEANFFCQPVSEMQHGTHLICVADVTQVLVTSGPAAPLVYTAGGYAGVTRR